MQEFFTHTISLISINLLKLRKTRMVRIYIHSTYLKAKNVSTVSKKMTRMQ